MLLLCIGVFGIAFCEAIGNQLCSKDGDASNSLEAAGATQSFEVNTAESGSTDGGNTGSKVLGMIYATCVGFCGGSILAPMHYVPVANSGLAFVISFGCGSMVASPLVAAFAFVLKGEIPPLHLAATLPAGLFSG